jgi:hypothetical protein
MNPEELKTIEVLQRVDNGALTRQAATLEAIDHADGPKVQMYPFEQEGTEGTEKKWGLALGLAMPALTFLLIPNRMLNRK